MVRHNKYMVSNGNLNFLEVGPGKVLSGLNKKINRDLTTLTLEPLKSLIPMKFDLNNKVAIVTGHLKVLEKLLL